LTKEKIILGIDPGTNILGFGIIRVDAKGPHYVTMGVFDLRKIKDPFEKLANIFAGVNELIEEYKPDELKKFDALYKSFSDRMRPLVYELGFLKQ
jgi:crossover junction endodeoxyribonuclease RuvC